MLERAAVTLTTLLAAVAAFCLGPSALAQTPQVSRTNLQRHDLSIPGREALQVRVDFPPGSAFPRHKHPGEEIVYVLKGALEYRLEGKAPVTPKAGDVVFVPAGVVHSVTNVGKDEASELATYVVEKGKPLVVQVK